MKTHDVVAIQTPHMHTMQVTVSALRIGTKQVTQSVFRQLPLLSVWNLTTGEIQGTLWGTVNYFWNGCGPYDAPHLHVVWQADNRLFRDCVYHPGNHRPHGVLDANRAIAAAEQRTLEAAIYICALAYWSRGWSLSPQEINAPWTVHWPCGVRTDFDIREPHPISKALREACAACCRRREKDSNVFKGYHSVSETCAQDTRPEGEGWYRNPVENQWKRSREETPEERERRVRAALTQSYDELHTALKAATPALDLQHLPKDASEAKNQLNPIAQAWLNACAYKEQLAAQFLHAYAQCEALPQLFIAV